VLPKANDPDFVCALEDVLEVYTRPSDPQRPQVCVDEVSKQLVKDVTPPVPMQPGQPAREDYEYERCGTVNLFMICEPLAGRRHVKVTDRRTSADFAQVLRDLSDVYYPQAEKIVLVMDNLNTHKLSVLYQVFPAAEARRILERFEVHHTPKHASWLNMAECELSVLSRQCLAQRIDSPSRLTEEVASWEQHRNAQQVRIDWRFTTADARIKLLRLYPELSPAHTAKTDH
jgi:DDE superfamily endonuclease